MSAANKAVFLSYARDDIVAARRIAEALRSNGVETWFDEDGTVHLPPELLALSLDGGRADPTTQERCSTADNP